MRLLQYAITLLLWRDTSKKNKIFATDINFLLQIIFISEKCGVPTSVTKRYELRFSLKSEPLDRPIGKA